MKQSTIPALAERRDATIEARVITVSPELAAEWLTRNDHNRSLSVRLVGQYATDMTEGRWPFTGQPIIFDAKGVLIDGQHRLSAQVKAGVTLDWLVVGGASRHAQDYVDIGRTRSVADQLQLAGRSLSSGVAAAARLDLVYSKVVSYPTKPQVRAHADAYYADFARASAVGYGVSKILRGSMAAYAVAYYRVARIDAALADRFFEQLRVGANLGEGSPILALRTVITKTSGEHSDRERVARINLLFKAWNLWVTGQKVKVFLRPPVDAVTPVAPALDEEAAS